MENVNTIKLLRGSFFFVAALSASEPTSTINDYTSVIAVGCNISKDTSAKPTINGTRDDALQELHKYQQIPMPHVTLPITATKKGTHIVN